MKRFMMTTAIGLLSLLAACGSGDRGGSGDIATTNSGNVILNDAQQNYAFTGDNETVANSAGEASNMMAPDAAVTNAR
jgi:hypothetical protein